MTIIRAVLGTLVSVVLIVVGIVLIRKKGKLTSSTDSGKVTNTPGCTSQVDNNVTEYQCNNVVVSYVVAGTTYKITFDATSSTDYRTKTSGITVHYDPTNPKDGNINPDDYTFAGWVTLVIGILIMIIVWTAMILARKYKFFAASEGVATGAGLVSGAIRHI